MSFAQWFGAVKGEKHSVAAPESNPSLPGGRRVRGYTISRLPFGAYLQALEKLQSLPGDLLKACFPGKAADEILTALKNLDEGALVQLIAGAAGAGGWGLSATRDSVVSTMPDTLAEFSRALRVTLAGSTIPLAIMSQYSSL